MPRRHLLAVSLLGVVAAFVGACSAKNDLAAVEKKAGTVAPAEEANCTAEFVWLQKDAYKDTPGRTNPLWPPHTTTTLTITCPDSSGQLEQVDYAFQNNHGTDPGTTNDAGVQMLTPMKDVTVTGTKTELEQLFSTYQGCVCDPVTQFLSVDSLQSVGAQEIVNSVVTYFQQNLVCEVDGGTDSLIQEITAGNLDAAIAQFSECTWSNGASFNDGLDAALTAFLQGTQETLAGYHVCNNDATLEATLFDTYQSTGKIGTCDKSSSTCSGPIWFYTPM